jgi:SAM-dependent methyltransferase
VRPGEAGPAEGLTHSEYARISDALFRLQRGLTGNRSLIGARYMDDPDLLAAYLFFYWPVSYAQVAGVLTQSGIRPARILDMGSGPGPATAALLDAGARSAVLVDSSASALDLARRVLAQGPAAADALRFLHADLEGPAPFEKASDLGHYDCVVFGHSLNELWIGVPDRAERVLALAGAASGCLSPEGFLMVVEPALLATSREALALRDGLAAAGWSVFAPCPGRSRHACPALAAGPAHTCHDELRWETPETVRILARRTGLDKDSLKAAWFLARPPFAPAALPRSAYPEDAFRVVSDPLLNKAGRIRYLLCGASGRFPFSAPAEDPRSRTSGFSYLRRGDVIRVENPENRESGWGLGSATRIEVLPGARDA